MTPPRTLSAGGINFDAEELLARPLWSPKWDAAQLRDVVGPTVITGGAGSIGGALAARLAAAGVPLCIADADERALDALSRSLPPRADLAYRLCDVADALELRDTLVGARARTVFHLAAKKHVKYAEHAVRNAVMTNVIGTWHVLEAARALPHVTRVVVASSDKGVAAKNVLGHTKRAAERLTAAFAPTWRAGNANSVRLCNVLGTAGNVLDHYVDEAKRGATLDVWSRDMTRYFCTVHEAVDLFLHAAVHDDQHVLTLDPGDATAIADLAERVCTALRGHGINARFEVSERFGDMHARHELLWGEEESVQRPGTTPAPAHIAYAPPALGPLEAMLQATNFARADNAAMRAWLDEFLALAG